MNGDRIEELEEKLSEREKRIEELEARLDDMKWFARSVNEYKDEKIENLGIIIQRIYEHCMRHYGGVSEKNAFVEDIINIINGHEAYDVPTAIERIEELEEIIDRRHDIIRKMKAWMKERTFDWQEQSIWKDFLIDHEDDELIQMMKEPEDGE